MKAQVTLELLILLAVFFSVLVLIVPKIFQLFELSVFALDVVNAQSFSEEIVLAVEQLSILENGSSKIIIANPWLEWNLSFRDDLLNVKIISEKIGKEKSLSKKTVLSFYFSSELIDSKTQIKLLKKDNKILIEYS